MTSLRFWRRAFREAARQHREAKQWHDAMHRMFFFSYFRPYASARIVNISAVGLKRYGE